MLRVFAQVSDVAHGLITEFWGGDNKIGNL